MEINEKKLNLVDDAIYYEGRKIGYRNCNNMFSPCSSLFVGCLQIIRNSFEEAINSWLYNIEKKES